MSEKKTGSFKTALFKGAFIHNSVLTQVIGICPILAAAHKISDAACIAVTLTLLLLINEILTNLLLKNVERWIRVAIYPLLSSVIISLSLPFLSMFTKDEASSLGIYLYLLSANALIVIRCEKLASRTTLKNCVFDAISSGIGYGAIALVVAAIRELLFSLTLSEGESFATSPFTASFIALLILGFLAAIQKAVVKKYFPFEATDTFSFERAEERAVFKDPGIGKKKKATAKEHTIRSRHEMKEENDE